MGILSLRNVETRGQIQHKFLSVRAHEPDERVSINGANTTKHFSKSSFENWRIKREGGVWPWTWRFQPSRTQRSAVNTTLIHRSSLCSPRTFSSLPSITPNPIIALSSILNWVTIVLNQLDYDALCWRHGYAGSFVRPLRQPRTASSNASAAFSGDFLCGRLQ